MRLKGKHVVITGGAGGLGSRISALMMKKGARVTIVDRATELSFEANLITGDLSTKEGIAAIASQLAELEPDILVNLAGVQYFGPLEQQEADFIQLSYMINLVAPVLLTQAVLPSMRKRGSGQIVNIGSIFGSINFAHFATYSSAKAGLKGFSEAMRRELHQSGVGVTYIAPRAVKTPLNSNMVMRFAELTRMKMDDPDIVVRRIVKAIIHDKKDVYFGFPESFFVRINALLPRLVDGSLAANDKIARNLFHIQHS
jgi:short-subunit dehydrogenase